MEFSSCSLAVKEAAGERNFWPGIFMEEGDENIPTGVTPVSHKHVRNLPQWGKQPVFIPSLMHLAKFYF